MQLCKITAGNNVGFKLSHFGTNLFHIIQRQGFAVCRFQNVVNNNQTVNEEALKLALCAFNTFQLLLFLIKTCLTEILFITS